MAKKKPVKSAVVVETPEFCGTGFFIYADNRATYANVPSFITTFSGIGKFCFFPDI